MFFDGVDDHVKLFEVEGGVTFEDELTVAAWMKADEFLGVHHPRLFHSSEGVGGGFDRWFFTWSPASAGSVVGFGVGNGQNSTVGVDSQNSLTPGEWHHVAAIFHGGLVKVLVDGVLESEAPLTFTSLNHINAPVFLGSALGNSHFNGALDEVGIWDRALSVEEVLNLYLMSSGDAQLPDYVPSDGLVAWYPLDGLAYDAGNYELDGVLEGPAVAEDRYGNLNGALSFDGVDDRVSIPHSDLTNPSVLTLSVWFKDSDFSNSDGQQSQLISKREFTGWGNAYEFGVGYPITEFPETPTIYSNFSVNGNHTIFHASESIFENQWHQAVYCHGEDSLFIYLDGERVLAQISPGPLPTNNELPTWFGGRPGGSGRHFFSGLLDDIGIWNRVLSHEEILALYISEQPISGCTDTAACNYESNAIVDDGSCIFPPVIALGEDIETCEDSVVLDAGEGFNFYEWSTGETTQTIVVTETGEYAVSASNVTENNHALQFNGTDASGAPAEPILFGTESFSVSVDCRLNAFKGNDSEPYSYIIGHPLTQGTGDHGFKIQTAGTSLNGGYQVHINDEGTTHFNVISFDNNSGTNVELDQWYDLTMVVDRDNAQFSFYVDGALIETQTIHPDFGNVDHPNGMSLGVQSIHGSSLLNGDLDNLQIWDVALSAEEVAHWQTTVPSGSETGLVGYWDFEEGEGDEAYDVSQVAPTIALDNVGWTDNTPIDVFDASCAASDTIQVSWLIRGCTDPEACNYVEDASCDDGTCASCEALQTACGPGTIWDAAMQMCIGDGSGDINLDGCVQLNDLLDLLSAYGNCAADESAWLCGDPLEYQGYDYETVQIGEQCWFAENLRSENYENGDEIPSNLGNSEWSSTISGATAIYEESGSNLETYGRLYNWFAVDDNRGLCPSGWQVPSDGQWTVLTNFLGGESTSGDKMKTTFGWSDGGNGSNLSGFSGLPGGLRGSNGNYVSYGLFGIWWSASQAGSGAWDRVLSSSNQSVYRGGNPKIEGFSVRCIKDSE